ncbi:MAG: hypothetical protein H0V57_02715 [Thermoleophilaceae bacterium]|nr:hypothetical protein [Thermoleophilaceae bacterium]
MEREPEQSFDELAEHGDEPNARDEAEAAANEASRIGGDVPPESDDPAFEAVEQGGGGEAEGFEQAEADLIEGASHGDPQPDPAQTAFTDETESESSTFVGGEPDEVDPTEVTSDPREGSDDPGEGPGIAADR